MFETKEREKLRHDIPMPGENVQSGQANNRVNQIDPGYERMRQDAEIDALFTYHSPTLEQAKQYETIRGAAKHLAHVIVANVPPCADRTAAMRKLRECVMTANAAIALDGRV